LLLSHVVLHEAVVGFICIDSLVIPSVWVLVMHINLLFWILVEWLAVVSRCILWLSFSSSPWGQD